MGFRTKGGGRTEGTFVIGEEDMIAERIKCQDVGSAYLPAAP